jgi:hypothetical protein
LNYWYGATYSHLVGTMTTSAYNYSNTASYTMVPHTTTFDASSALESVLACTLSESYWAEYDFTLTMCMDYTIKPTAATTSIAYRSGYSPFPSGGVIPTSDAALYDVYYLDMMPSATAAIALAPNVTQVETSATPFVYFTAYEVDSGDRTETISLLSAQVYPYSMKGVEDASTATGSLPEGFLEQITQSACDAGQLQAVVTVLIVVDLYYQNWPMIDPFLVHFESTALGFDDPSVIINNIPTGTKVIPVTVADWDLPGDSKATTTSVNPDNRPDTIPTTQAGSGGSPFLIISQPDRITVGTIGTDPVVIGPSSEVVVGSQTLHPGGSPIIVGGGTPISLIPSATAIVVDGSTSSLPQVNISPAQQPPVRPPPVLTIGSATLTPNAATQFFITPGQTLTPGGIATIDGTVVSLAPSASFVVIGGSTQVLPTGAASPLVVTSPPRIVVGGSTVTAQSAQPGPGNRNNQDNSKPGPTFVVSGQTLAPGAPAITVSGTTLSLAPSGSALIINGVTSTLATPAPPTIMPTTLTIGNEIFSPLHSAERPIVVAGQTLAPGGPAITISGTILSLAPSASFVVVNGATSNIANPAAPTITVGGGVFSAAQASSAPIFVIGGQSLAPGGSAITVSGTTLSLAPSAAFVVVNGVISTIASPTVLTIPPPTITIGNEVFSALPESSGLSFVIGDHTLLPGSPAVIVSGTTLSLALSASFVVINGVTSTLAKPAAAQITPPPLTIGNVTFRPLPGTGTAYLISSILLTPGGSIVVASTTISLAMAASALIINGQTSSISQAQPIITNPPLLTIGSQTYIALSGSGTTFVIGGQTLTPGGSVVVDGTTISLVSEATQLVYGSGGKSTTSVLFPATTTRSPSITSKESLGAGANVSDSNGQAAATSSLQGAAPSIRGFLYAILSTVSVLYFPVIVLGGL